MTSEDSECTFFQRTAEHGAVRKIQSIETLGPNDQAHCMPGLPWLFPFGVQRFLKWNSKHFAKQIFVTSPPWTPLSLEVVMVYEHQAEEADVTQFQKLHVEERYA